MNTTTPTPSPAVGHWRTLPDHLPVTREAVSLATGRPIGFVAACENDPDGSLCGPAPRSGFKTAGQWFEFLPGVQP